MADVAANVEVSPAPATGETVATAGNGVVAKGSGFDDCFVEPSKSQEKAKNRFSDDFSGSDGKSPSRSEQGDGTGQTAATPQAVLEPMKPKPEQMRRNWESFDDDALPRRKEARDAGSRFQADDDDDHESSPVVCGVDVHTKQSEWTALSDTLAHQHPTETSRQTSQGDLPFRRTQSMRADANRSVRIVDSLRQQRRLSGGGGVLDDDSKPTFANEDELTRKLKVDREWDCFLRLPKKPPGMKIPWFPVRVSVKDGVLSIKKGAMSSVRKGRGKSDIISSIKEEIVLQHSHQVVGPMTRAFERRTKLHQIKLQQAVVQEKRTLKRFLLVEHVTSNHTQVKFGSQDLSVMKSVSEAITEAVRQLPATRARGVAYRMNEVFVDVKEASDILMNCDGAVLDRKSLNRIIVQAFLTGAPECRLALNDVEATLLQGKSLLSQSMARQVRLCNVVLHPCVNKESYQSSRDLKFQPVDGCTFELLRCSVDPHVSPPINVSCLMDYNQTHNTVKITSSFIVRKKHALRQRPITDLVIKFPIPASWNSLFLTESKFGQQRSVGSTASLRGSFRRKIKSRECQIETFLGSAKFESEQGAIMWRIGTYSRTSQSHSFSCTISLKGGMEKPDVQSSFAEVMYSVPGSSTGLSVKGFHVDDTVTDTWVKYQIEYHYRVQMFPDLSID